MVRVLVMGPKKKRWVQVLLVDWVAQEVFRIFSNTITATATSDRRCHLQSDVGHVISCLLATLASTVPPVVDWVAAMWDWVAEEVFRIFSAHNHRHCHQ